MSAKPISPFRQAWFRWKSLRNVPFRKRFLVGLDLQGNTYWEFRDTLSPGRMRRIVEYPSSIQYSDIKLSPQWHQWLRHTRRDAPTLQEQSADELRLQRLKVLAAEADKRWAAKKSLLDSPVQEATLPLSGNKANDAGFLKGVGKEDAWSPKTDSLDDREASETTGRSRTIEETQGQDRVPRFSELQDGRRKEHKHTEDPWKQVRGGPSEEWQPQAAQLTPTKR